MSSINGDAVSYETKLEFLKNLRIAKNLFFHPRVQTDGSQVSPVAAARMIARAAIWLTPRSVRGFNSDDFRELGAERQQELQAAIRDFLEVAEQVPAKEVAGPEQLTRARTSFVKILEILERYVPAPPEATNVEEALKGIELPPWVVNWDYEFGSDADDMPAVWVNFFVDEENLPGKEIELGKFASQVTIKIRHARR